MIDIESARLVIQRNSFIGDTTKLREMATQGRSVAPLSGAAEYQWGNLSRIPLLTSRVADSNGAHPFFRHIFGDPNPAGRNEWVGAIDQRVRASSDENLRRIDELAQTGDYVQKDVLIVGGGPLSSLAADILGPYVDLTLITDQDSVGKPWRDRPIFLMSQVWGDRDGVRFPHISTALSPISANGHTQQLEADILLSEGRNHEAQGDPILRTRVSGMDFGKVVATKLASSVSDFMVGQDVPPEHIEIDSDGMKIVEIRDAQTGKVRKFKANTVLYLPGPGDEVCRVAEYKDAYTESKETINQFIRDTKDLINQGRVGEVSVDLPQVLSLTLLERLYSLYNYSGRRPELFPLAQLINNDTVDIGIIGEGNAAKALIELLQGLAPQEAYQDRARVTAPEITVYTASSTPSRLIAKESVGVVPYQSWATGERILDIISGQSSHEVDVYTPQRRHTHLFVATGVQKRNFAQEFGFPIGKVNDLEGNVVALGNTDVGVYVGGSGTGFTSDDFPPPLRRIAEELQLPKHLISLWAQAPLVERLCWTIVGNRSNPSNNL